MAGHVVPVSLYPCRRQVNFGETREAQEACAATDPVVTCENAGVFVPGDRRELARLYIVVQCGHEHAGALVRVVVFVVLLGFAAWHWPVPISRREADKPGETTVGDSANRRYVAAQQHNREPVNG